MLIANLLVRHFKFLEFVFSHKDTRSVRTRRLARIPIHEYGYRTNAHACTYTPHTRTLHHTRLHERSYIGRKRWVGGEEIRWRLASEKFLKRYWSTHCTDRRGANAVAFSFFSFSKRNWKHTFFANAECWREFFSFIDFSWIISSSDLQTKKIDASCSGEQCATQVPSTSLHSKWINHKVSLIGSVHGSEIRLTYRSLETQDR